jgi:hypothetical protein
VLQAGSEGVSSAQARRAPAQLPWSGLLCTHNCIIAQLLCFLLSHNGAIVERSSTILVVISVCID